MPKRKINNLDIFNPSRILNNLISDYVSGEFDKKKVFYRAEVVRVDNIGGSLENNNPKGSIKAKIISNNYDLFTSEDNLKVFWPLFSHDLMPIKESEHVYVVFEDEKKTHGLWITRIPEPNNVDDKNITPGYKKYKENKDNKLQTDTQAQQAVHDSSQPVKIPELSKTQFSKEKTPEFNARVGDRVIQGSNNTLIVLSRDRKDSVDSGQKDNAGTIDIVAGRDGKDISFSGDKSRIYVSQNCNIDEYFDTKSVGTFDAGVSAAIGIKSDEIRIKAVNGMKIVVDNGEVYIKCQKATIESNETKIDSSTGVLVKSNAIKVGSEASIEPLVLGTQLTTFLSALLTALNTDAVGGGIAFGIPATVQLPATAAAFSALSPLIPNLISKKHTTE